MVTPRLLKSVVTISVSIFLMPVTSWVDGLPNHTFASAALASVPEQLKTALNYAPPRRGTPRRTQGTGSRGCSQSQPVALELIVPNDHTAQTVSGHPTFFWHVSDIPNQPVEFSLVEAGVAQPIFVKQIQPQKPGLVRMEMPKNLPELSPDKEYRWSVSLVCNANRRSNDTFAQSWVKRVSGTAALEQQLATARSDRDRALVYAKAGLWYDALNAISTAQAANPTDSSIREDFLNLLDQAGLTKVALQERQHVAKQ
jgi:hypothetical protein